MLVLTLGDTVLCRQQPLLHEALQHGAHGRPVDQLEYKQVGLQRDREAINTTPYMGELHTDMIRPCVWVYL